MAVPQPRLGANRYRIQRKVGSGAFGDVYIGTDRNTDKQVAIKLENLNVHNSVLPYEYRVYRHLRGVPGIPAVKWFGELKRPNVPHHMLVMELLGPSLEDLFNYNGGRFSVKTVLMLGDQMLARIEAVHAKSFLHRDIKPENFLMGMGSNTYKLYLIDFGLAKMYQNFKTKHHIPYRQDKSLTGTARYASLNAQQGIEQGRRDDLEAVGYVLIYFLRGSLPWQNLHASTKQQKYDRIREVKQSTSICQDLASRVCNVFEVLPWTSL
ncbi:Casein kinase I isoform delta-like [Orchesella cincta]|uniref:non-specific serine/threonine protein kinase n=1 Tax=Orchesella cincta TaxID=48709 RepID=A0A1D2ML14_ORCCI|nr:Casein kinase I isoform delta-like [Orchesella cincta]